MDKRFLAAAVGLAAVPVPALAQGEPGAAPSPAAAGCYVEIAKLMQDPPTGIGELGVAIREIDGKLRPQVDEVNALKALVARLEQRPVEPVNVAVQAAGGGFDDEGPALPAPVAGDPSYEELRRLQDELQAKQDQLKRDYAEQHRLLVGPVQTRVSARAQAFASERGCAGLKMARTPDLAALATAGARNMTADFVSWYLASKS